MAAARNNARAATAEGQWRCPDRRLTQPSHLRDKPSRANQRAQDTQKQGDQKQDTKQDAQKQDTKQDAQKQDTKQDAQKQDTKQDAQKQDTKQTPRSRTPNQRRPEERKRAVAGSDKAGGGGKTLSAEQKTKIRDDGHQLETASA